MGKIKLQPLAEEHALKSWQWRNDVEVWKHTGHSPDKSITLEMEQEWIKKVLQRPGEKRFAILDAETGIYIGNVQLTGINPYDAEFHIFIGDRDFWGKGCGYHATQLMIEHGFTELKLQSIFLDVRKENNAAIRIYEKNGFKDIFEYDDMRRMAVYSSQSQPKVSVFVMTYNHGKYIAEALDGIINQQVDFSFDIVVGDDFSSDNTRVILQEYAVRYPSKFKLLFYPHNIGAWQNQKWVLKNCTGTYTAMCEGDDYWNNKGKLALQAAFLDENPDYSITFHDVYLMEPSGKKRRRYELKIPETTDLHYLLMNKTYISTLSVVFRKNETLLDYLEHFSNVSFGDYFIYIHLAYSGKIKYLPQIMGVYRIHNAGSWSQLSGNEAHEQVYYSLIELYQRLFEIDKPYLKIHIYKVLESIVKEKYLNNNLSNLEKYYHQAVGIDFTMVNYLLDVVKRNLDAGQLSSSLPIGVLFKALLKKIRRKLL